MEGFRDQLHSLAPQLSQLYPRRKIDLFDAVRQTRIEAHPADIPLLAGSFHDVFRPWGELPDGQRQVLALPNFEKPPLQQLSQRLGRSPSAIAGLPFRGMKMLRRVLVAGV